VFEWDDANVDHIAEYGVEPEEAEEAVDDRFKAAVSAHSGRDRIIGKTGDGRVLCVVLDRRATGWRVVTARDATDSEKRAYPRRNR
jgi:uncharacterized DUF497 family protein